MELFGIDEQFTRIKLKNQLGNQLEKMTREELIETCLNLATAYQTARSYGKNLLDLTLKLKEDYKTLYAAASTLTLAIQEASQRKQQKSSSSSALDSAQPPGYLTSPHE